MLKVVILLLTLLCLDYSRLSDFWQMNLQLSARLLLVLLAVLEQSAIANKKVKDSRSLNENILLFGSLQACNRQTI